jgi:hypothetical protein
VIAVGWQAERCRRSQRGSLIPYVLALAFAGVGCDRPGLPQDLTVATHGGSRLRVVAWRPVEAGGSVFAGWRDSAKGIDCVMKATGPSTAACLPEQEETDWRYFRDPDCRRPVHMVLAGGLPDVQITVDLCLQSVRVFRPGAMATLETIYELDAFDGSCAALKGPTTVRQLDDVTAEYASLDVRHGAAVAGIAPRLLVGQDGARDVWGWWDATRGAACTFPWLDLDWHLKAPWPSEDGSWRCLPLRGRDYVDSFQHQSRLRFGDAQCSSFTAIVPAVERCRPGRWDYWWGDYAYHSLGCESRVKVWRLGAVVPAAFQRAASGCAPETRSWARPSQVKALELMDFRAWPTATLGPPRGEGRLRTRAIETAAGASRGVLWDATLDSECHLARRADGAMSCIPDGLSGSGNAFFGDAACTRKLLYAQRPCPKPRYYVQAVLPPNGESRVFTLEEHAGEVYSRSGGCTAYQPNASTLGGPVGGAWFLVGPEVPPADLVQLEEVTQ